MGNNNTLLTCANCGNGEESSDSLKKCGTCKMVKYEKIEMVVPYGCTFWWYGTQNTVKSTTK